MDDIISVIIPVYNAAQYLRACLDSVLGQTYRHLQIIIVDDGSTDDSVSILREYASRDPRIQIIDTPHAGVSAARNAGIEAATGQQVAFVDADDMLPPYAFELLHRALKRAEADIVAGKYVTFTDLAPDLSMNPRTKIDLISGETAIVRCLLRRDGMDNSVWGKLYARKIFDSKLHFRPGRFEDLDIIYRIYDRAHRVALVRGTVYYYRRHDASFISDPDAEGRFDALMVCERMMQYTHLFSRRIKQAVMTRLLAASYNTLALLDRTHNMSEKERDEMRRRCYKYIKRARIHVLRTKGVRKRDRMGALLAYMPRSVIKSVIRRHNPIET